MKRSLIALGLMGLVMAGTQAVAQDTSSDQQKKPTMSHKAMSHKMKKCIERQKATNSGMTQEAMETTCRNEAKGNGTKTGNDLDSGPKANTPDEKTPNQ